MDAGTDLASSILGAWPGVVTLGGVGTAFYFLIRVLFSIRGQLEEADKRTKAARADANQAEAALDDERAKRHRVEDELSKVRIEAAALRGELIGLRGHGQAT